MCQATKYLRGDVWRSESHSGTDWSIAGEDHTTVVAGGIPLRISVSTFIT